MGSLHQLLAAALAAPVLAGCGEGASTPTGPSLVHLDPRMADGTSARESLALAELVVRGWEALDSAAGRAPWTWSGPTPSRRPGGGLILDCGLTDSGPAALAIDWEPGAAPRFDALRLGTTFHGGSTAAVRLEFHDGRRIERTVAVPYDGARTELDLELPEAAAGGLRSLELAPVIGGDRRSLELTGLALVQKGLPDPAAPPVSGDHGLLALDGQLRRVWPAGRGVRLEVDVARVPGQRFQVEAWPGPGANPKQVVTVGLRQDSVQGMTARSMAHTLRPDRPLRIDLALDDLPGDAPVQIALQTQYHDASLGPADVPAGTHDATAPGEVAVLWSEPRLVLPRNAYTPPNLVLVTFDTTRADVAADPAVAPTLAALAQEPGGLAFANAWSPSNTTTPAHASMLTGLLPHRHGAVAVGRRFRAAEGSSLAERLRAAGYRTAAAVSVEHLDAAHGFARGFDRFLDPAPGAQRDGRKALDFAREVLAEARAGGEPLFLWIHWFDPHAPYLLPSGSQAPHRLPAPPGDLATKEPIPAAARDTVRLAWLPPEDDLAALVARYRAGVAFTDGLLGELVDELRAGGLWDDTVLAVTADHGESLGEAHIHGNHASLYPSTLRVPLVLRIPWHEELEPHQLAAPVSSMDLFPTLLELAGVPAGDGLDGRSLLRPEPDRRLWLEGDRLAQVGLVDGDRQWIGTLRRVSLGFTDTPVWSDPGDAELLDLGAPLFWRERPDPGTADDLRQAWQAFVEDLDQGGLDELLSAEERATLEALGYLGDG